MDSPDNIYAYARNHVRSTYAERFSGGNSALALVIFTERLSETAKNALEKSFAAIGFEADERAYVDVSGLSAEEAFDVVEGADPVALVAADETAANLYAQAVRQAFPPMRRVRVFGREARAFPHINALMQEEADKQAVWHLLKSLA